MTDERRLVDPGGCYAADGIRAVEEHALKVMELLPGAHIERTHDVVQIEHDVEAGVVVLVTREALELRLPHIEWAMGAYGSALSSRLWKRVEWDQLDPDELDELLAELQATRRGEFSVCRYCGDQFPPEQFFETSVCHTCAEQHLGIVF